MNSTAPAQPWWTFGPCQTRVVTLANGQRIAAPYLLRSVAAPTVTPRAIRAALAKEEAA